MYSKEEKAPLSEEERKALSKKRFYWTLVALDVLLVILVLWEIFELFLAH